MADVIIETGTDRKLPTGLLEIKNEIQTWASREAYVRYDDITLDVYGAERRRALRVVIARIAKEELFFLVVCLTVIVSFSKNLFVPFSGILPSQIGFPLAIMTLMLPIFWLQIILCQMVFIPTGKVSSFIVCYCTRIRTIWLVIGSFLLSFFFYQLLPASGIVDMFYERLSYLGPFPIAEWVETIVMLLKLTAIPLFVSACISALIPAGLAHIWTAEIKKRKQITEILRGSL